METFIASPADMWSVWKLTYDVYLEEGYCQPNDSGILQHYPHLDNIPETTVFCTKDDDGILQGTNSLTKDGPRGLHTEICFPEETAAVRYECYQNNLILGASWRIVTSPNNRGKTRVARPRCLRLKRHASPERKPPDRYKHHLRPGGKNLDGCRRGWRKVVAG